MKNNIVERKPRYLLALVMIIFSALQVSRNHKNHDWLYEGFVLLTGILIGVVIGKWLSERDKTRASQDSQNT